MYERTKKFRGVPMEEVVRLYCGEKWPAEQIAKKYGTAWSNVYRWLKKAGVDRRIAARQAFTADPKLIEDLYHRQGLTTKDIGKMFGVDDMTILRFLKRNNIPRRPPGRYRKPTTISKKK